MIAEEIPCNWIKGKMRANPKNGQGLNLQMNDQ